MVQNASLRPQWDTMAENVRSWFEAAPVEEIVADTFGAQEMPELDFLQESASDLAVAEPPAADLPKAASNAASPVKTEVQKNSFALVVGAFSDIRNAERLASDLQKAGYPAKVLRANVGLTKVALRTFANRDAAQAAKEEAKVAFPAVWIYSE